MTQDERKGGGPASPILVADRRYSTSAPRPRSGGTGGGAGGGGNKGGGNSTPPRRKPTPRRVPKKRGFFGSIAAVIFGIFRAIWSVFWKLGLTAVVILGAIVFVKSTSLPEMAELVDGRTRGSVTLADRYGETFAWRGDHFAGMISSQDVAPVLRNAVVATEDRRFNWHIGVDPIGIASAVRINLAEGRGALQGNGGSTITQQTAKLLCLGRPFVPSEWESEAAYEADCRRTTIMRKVEEAIYAMAMEIRYSKDEILTLYLNRAYLGAGARGFEAGAQRYFGKSAREVNASEAAMLAGLLQAPSALAPTSNLARSQNRANVVIGLMEQQGFITAAQATEARNNPAQLSAAAAARAGGYFADWVMESGPEFFTRDTTEDVIIRTTLDPRIQTVAENAVTHVFAESVREGSQAQAAVVVMSADGAVRAMVGGRDLRASGAFNRATQAQRQTGSSFKPFIYATALDQGIGPMEIVDDSPMTINVRGSGPWSPQNYDRTFKGWITLTQALAESRNIPAVRLSEAVGRQNVARIAHAFGVTGDISEGPAMALGASESTLIEMTGTYAGFLNGGSEVTPYGLVELRLQGDDTSLMGTMGGIGDRVISENAARQLNWMMWRAVEEGTGRRARVNGWQIAGKSGTTSAARDAWFIGFSADYVIGVWMGYDNNTPLNGVTGGGIPAQIFQETMAGVLEGMSPTPLPMTAPGEQIDFVDPSGLTADGGGFLPSGDSALDRALLEAFGAPAGSLPPDTSNLPTAGSGDNSQDAITNALQGILGGAN
ncbi:transglycosylase domain-containing protein [Ketogulonicigenium vulgare]|uniref:peptidoglycan glycosyltransferase n=1 Tax=Ketogulonicigenium vulgare (strain WSH-001) TaxID=759362 RepID=F9Y7T6_KETVW|nr:PBP1A family penicillin-binding protein [Ketogulonicigenium vulgare]AEM39902.1 Glycosyltransferase, family 51 [Ketogulonicigenium vulgare WSH-001]ALJ80118.1 glycosyl transferase [Ketogulonicigenium vulgare]ANW32987.1 glycosyl transferase [Ketogulonicigenium vulgare]AOZ53595.1 Glycosyltransferase, family 51 [Ketogulonicigenium vulgare]